MRPPLPLKSCPSNHFERADSLCSNVSTPPSSVAILPETTPSSALLPPVASALSPPLPDRSPFHNSTVSIADLYQDSDAGSIDDDGIVDFVDQDTKGLGSESDLGGLERVIHVDEDEDENCGEDLLIEGPLEEDLPESTARSRSPSFHPLLRNPLTSISPLQQHFLPPISNVEPEPTQLEANSSVEPQLANAPSRSPSPSPEVIFEAQAEPEAAPSLLVLKDEGALPIEKGLDDQRVEAAATPYARSPILTPSIHRLSLIAFPTTTGHFRR